MTPFEVDMQLQRPVFSMMRRGIRVDEAKRKDLSEHYDGEWIKFQKSLDHVAMRPINVNSPPQMKALFYDELKFPPRRKEGKVTTDEDALRAMMAQAEEKMKGSKTQEAKNKWLRAFISAKLVLKIREIRKLKSSYLDVEIDQDHRARCTISVGGTETMRFSHSKTLWGTGLNQATVPHKLRIFYIADEDMELAEFDLNRGESWVYTFLSMDPELLRIHQGGLDFHAETASVIQGAFGGRDLTPDEIRRLAKSGDDFGYRIRYLGKKVNHASAYRMGPFRAAEVVNTEADDTGITVIPSQMSKAQGLWRRKYFGIEGWWNGIDKQLETTRRLITPYGRERVFFGFMSDHLKKEATAYVPQSTSVDYLNRGMLRVFDELVDKGAYGLQLLHQNHDSILVQYPRQHRTSVVPEIVGRLTSHPVVINGHRVTIPVDAQCGLNWGDYHPEKNPNGMREYKGI
jgi:DNA polymerase-1